MAHHSRSRDLCIWKQPWTVRLWSAGSRAGCHPLRTVASARRRAPEAGQQKTTSVFYCLTLYRRCLTRADPMIRASVGLDWALIGNGRATRIACRILLLQYGTRDGERYARVCLPGGPRIRARLPRAWLFWLPSIRPLLPQITTCGCMHDSRGSRAHSMSQ